MLWLTRVACFSVAITLAGGFGAMGGVASAQTAAGAPTPAAQPPKPRAQGIAVLALGGVRSDAFDLARAVYGSHLRPANLDEVRARVLAGSPPPANASRDLRELAELRAGVTGEDAAGRRLLVGLAQQVGAEALIVVKLERAVAPAAAAPEAPDAPGAPDADADAGGGAADGGAADGGAAARAAAFEGSTGDAGAASPGTPGNGAPAMSVVARVFLAETGEFDAAHYRPEPGLKGAAAWAATVASLKARFPNSSRAVSPIRATAPTPVKIRPEGEKSSPFYTSAWFWAAIGGAALVGGAIYFASQDTSADPIHLQMRVPR